MTTKRFTILYGLDEDPFDWDILDNEKDAIICQYNGTPICELLNELHEENERLKAQLYCDDEEGVCNICKYHYLEKGETYEKYYISKCKKGHEQFSRTDVKYCDDFELKGDVE